MNYKKAFKEVKQYYFTVLLVFLNILIFLICTFTGNLLYNKGAFYVWNVVIEKEYYRLLCSGLAVTYGFQLFLTIGGAIKMIPSTGVTYPLISYGGSSLMSTIFMFFIVQGVKINENKQ